MLDALPGSLNISLHDGAPGASGTDNEISGGGYSRQSGTFSAASGGERLLSSAVDFDGEANQNVTHAGFWDGSTFKGSSPLAGDTQFNSEGELRVTTATALTIED